MYNKVSGQYTQSVGVMGTNYEVINTTKGWQKVTGVWESDWYDSKNFNRIGALVCTKSGQQVDFTVGFLWAEDDKGEVVGFDWLGEGSNASAICGSKDILGSKFKLQVICADATIQANIRLFNY